MANSGFSIYTDVKFDQRRLRDQLEKDKYTIKARIDAEKIKQQLENEIYPASIGEKIGQQITTGITRNIQGVLTPVQRAVESFSNQFGRITQVTTDYTNSGKVLREMKQITDRTTRTMVEFDKVTGGTKTTIKTLVNGVTECRREIKNFQTQTGETVEEIRNFNQSGEQVGETIRNVSKNIVELERNMERTKTTILSVDGNRYSNAITSSGYGYKKMKCLCLINNKINNIFLIKNMMIK